jgi:hypothetical protein
VDAILVAVRAVGRLRIRNAACREQQHKRRQKPAKMFICAS